MPAPAKPRLCRLCKGPVVGRVDKIFCSVACKSHYHVQLRRATNTNETVIRIDRILHRNRSILLELMGKHKTQKKPPRIELDKKRFYYSYHTHSHVNKQGKTYYYIYDFGWMSFSDQEVLIIRKR